MSRWSDEFENHPIHQLLSQAAKYLETEVENTDAEFELERLRLTNVVGNLREIIEGLDRDFFPKPLLDQINSHLSQPNFLPQLQSYSSDGMLNHLQVVNNHITQYSPQIFNLAAMSRPMESQKLISNAEQAFGSFMASMESTANDTDERFTEHETKLAAISEKADALEKQLEGLDTSTNDKLTEWQDDFTEKQATRAQEDSDAQLERDTKFEELLSKWEGSIEAQRTDIAQVQTEKLQATLDHFHENGETVLKDVNQKHEEVKEIHKLVGRDSVAGGYQTSAGEEKLEANRWRWISLGCLAAAITWLGIKYWEGFTPTASGSLNWPEIITASSLTAVFLVAAGYTSTQSKLHRDNEKLLRSYALETKALDPFIASLEKEEQQAIKAELVRRMFGQQNTNPTGKSATQDTGTMSKFMEKVSNTVTDAVGKAIGKG